MYRLFIKRKFINLALLQLLVAVLIMAHSWKSNVSMISIDQQLVIDSEECKEFSTDIANINSIAFSKDEDTLESAIADGERIELSIYDENGTEIWNRQVPVDDITTGSFQVFIDISDDILELSKDGQYRYECRLNGNVIDGISLMLCGDAEPITQYYLMVCISILLALILLFILFYTRKGSFYIRFAIIMMTLGVVNNICIVPMVAPDELYHFQHAYALSNDIVGSDASGAYDTIIDQDGEVNFRVSIGSSNQSLIDFYTIIDDYDGQAEKTFSRYLPDSFYECCYIPSALGITIARLFGAPFQIVLISGRLANLLLLVVISIISMKCCNSLKFAIAAICLLPSTVWLMSSYTYDSWNLAFCLLFVALCFRIRESRKCIRIAEIIGLLIVLLLFTPIKFVYAIMILAVILIPFDQFKGMNKSSKVVVLVSVISLVMLLLAIRGKEALAYLTTSSMDTRGVRNLTTAQSYTMQWAVKHPVYILLTYLYTTIKEFWMLLRSCFVNETFAWMVPAYIIVSVIIVFTLIMMSALREYKINKNDRIKSTTIMLLSIIAVFTAFLFLYSTVSSGNYGEITGMQGRYFLPFLIYLAVAIKSDKVSVLVDNSKNMVLPGLAEYDSRKVLIYFLVLLNLCVAFFESVGMMNIPISYGG